MSTLSEVRQGRADARRRAQGDVPLSFTRLTRVTTQAIDRHLIDLMILAVVVTIVAFVHAIGMRHFPLWLEDPGTYLSQAYSVMDRGSLSPYSFFYDHAPGGWIQIALYAWLTNGFNRYESTWDFGSEIMLVAKIVTSILMYCLARRMNVSSPFAAFAVLCFGLCPLNIASTRLLYLDNFAMAWALAAFLLAANPRHSLRAAAGASFCFSIAALSKETILVALPAFIWMMIQNSHSRNRVKAIVVSAAASAVIFMYPLMALLKGEFFISEDRNGLLKTAMWQLKNRRPSGAIIGTDPNTGKFGIDTSTDTYDMFVFWFEKDWFVFAAGSVATIIALIFWKEWRPIAAVPALASVVFFTNSYVPFMHSLMLMPWFCLLFAVALDKTLSGVKNDKHRVLGGAVVAALVMSVMLPFWAGELRYAMTSSEPSPLRLAREWVRDNVPRDKVLVVHDAIWTDFVVRDNFKEENVVMAFKVDTDPAVCRRVRKVDYIVLPEFYYGDGNNSGKYASLVEAKANAVPMAKFGYDYKNQVTVYRVSPDHLLPKLRGPGKSCGHPKKTS